MSSENTTDLLDENINNPIEENTINPFDDTESTILYTHIEDKNPLSEIMDRMNGLSLASFSPKKADSSIVNLTGEISNITDLSTNEEVNKSNINKSEDVVYLQCFVDTIRNLQKKFNKLMKNKFVHKEVVTEIFEKLQSGDSVAAKEHLKEILDKKVILNINQKEISKFINVTFPLVYKEILDNLDNLSILKKDIVYINKTLLEKYHENTNQASIVREEFNNYIRKFKNDINDIIKFSENESIESFCKELADSIKKIDKDMKNIKHKNKLIKKNSDIEDLKKQIEEKKLTIKQLQSQNVSFSEIITKLDTTNIKLKKECVILSNEYRKVTDSLKSKNTIIDKLKRILEVLQKQVGSKQDFPIEDLKKKISKLQLKIEKEGNQEKKLKLQNELGDYEKGLRILRNYIRNRLK